MFLDELGQRLKEGISERKRKSSLRSLEQQPLFRTERRGFLRALEQTQGRKIIAEIKRSSPSRGIIRKEFDASAIAKSYESNGAAALSVVTQPEFFRGEAGYLEAARAVTNLPVLMKDFFIDSFQVYEAKSHGADAVLLIVQMVGDALLQEIYRTGQELGLDVLVEVHSENDLDRALALEPALVGINNRNLQDLGVDIKTTERILPLVPSGVLVVSESGLRTSQDLFRLEGKGVHAFLIGEWLMEAQDPGERLAHLLSW